METILPSANDIRSFETLIKRYREITILKMLALNKEQGLCLDFIKNPDITMQEEYSDDMTENYFSRIKSDQDKIVLLKKYFKDVQKEGKFSANDRLIFRNLNPELRNTLKYNI